MRGFVLLGDHNVLRLPLGCPKEKRLPFIPSCEDTLWRISLRRTDFTRSFFELFVGLDKNVCEFIFV